MYNENIASASDNFERYKERLTNFSREFEFGLFLLIIRKNFLWVLLFFALAFAGAFLFIRYTQTVYEAGAIMQINHENNASKILGPETFLDHQDISKDVELIKSKLFLRHALNQLPLEVSYFNQGRYLGF
jgi:tyrosine-protein kinase Etk/Wzc